MEAHILFLKPIEAQYKSGAILDNIDLEHAIDTDAEDEYHIRLARRSVYASMNDIKAYMMSKHPELDMRTWSIRYSGVGEASRTGIVVSVGGQEFAITQEEYEKIKVEHLDWGIYVNKVDGFHVPIYGEEAEWIRDRGDSYIDDALIAEATDELKKTLLAIPQEELRERLEFDYYDPSPRRLLTVMMAAKVFAESIDCVAAIRIS